MSEPDVGNHSERRLSNVGPYILLPLIFATAVSILCCVYVSFPSLSQEELVHFKLPTNISDARNLGIVLSKYTESHYWSVLGGFIVTYIFLQSFAIPGSIFLSILSGYLFRFPIALLLVCSCSAIGALICYSIFHIFGAGLVKHHFAQRVEQWAGQVQGHREHLFNYIVFLRITPFLPNWFINIASPVIGVPISPFFWGTFIGVGPPSVLFIQAGFTLNELTHSPNSTISINSLMVLGGCALLSLLPVIFKEKLRAKVE